MELSLQGYEVQGCEVGDATYEAVASLEPDVVLLELMLPAFSGLEVLKGLRERFPDTPVVIVTTQDTEADRAYALDAGAADFVGKPFSPEDLSLRIDLVLGRAGGRDPGNLSVGDFTIDVARKLIRKGTKIIPVTTNEWALLLALFEAGEGGLSTAELFDRVFGPDARSLPLLKHWINRLQTRLTEAGATTLSVVGDEHSRYRLHVSSA